MGPRLKHTLCLLQILVVAVVGQNEHYTGNEVEQDIAGAVLYPHSLSKPYLGANLRIPNWRFYGDTLVTKQYVRLTADEQSQAGQLWNTAPINSQHWVAEVEFRVFGDSPRLFGDGLVFWLTKDYGKPGNTFGNQDDFVGLAIMFDTYGNNKGEHSHGHPYVSAMVNDGTKRYDHDLDGVNTELGGCQASFRGKEFPTRARISYIKDVLTVDLDYRGINMWQRCFSEKGVYLPTGMHFGFSAITGGLSDNHDIISLLVKAVAPPSGSGTQTEEDRANMLPRTDRVVKEKQIAGSRHTSSSTSGSGGFFSHFMTAITYLVVIVAIVAAVLYVVRMKMRERDMKRF